MKIDMIQGGNMSQKRQTVKPNLNKYEVKCAKITMNELQSKPFKNRASVMSKSGRPSIGRSSIACSETSSMLGTTPSGASSVKIELKEFNNLLSQLHQWIFI